MSDSQLNQPASMDALGDQTEGLCDGEDLRWRRRFESVCRFGKRFGIACLTSLISFGPIPSARDRRSH